MSQVKKRKCCCDRHEAEDHNPGRIERMVTWLAESADEDRILGEYVRPEPRQNTSAFRQAEARRAPKKLAAR